MMEEIDFFDQEKPLATDSVEHNKKNASNSSDTPTFDAASRNTSEPLRLPRTGGSSRGTFLRDTIQSQIPTSEQLQKRSVFLRDTVQSQIPTSEQLQKTKQQAGKVFKRFGNHLSKINLGNLIDRMEQDQGLADSLEHLNSRMKEEVERQEVRREAEELTLKVITDHLGEFLVENPLGTYEEWIQDLHPENANQGLLFSDIQQIDERFYIMESDHRRLWNEAVEKQETGRNGDTNNKTSYAHRLVKARTQIWGKAPGAHNNTNTPSQENKSGFTDNPLDNNSMIDLLSASNTQNASAGATATSDPLNENDTEEIDFFAPTANSRTDDITSSGNSCLETVQNDSKKDPFQDLLQF